MSNFWVTSSNSASETLATITFSVRAWSSLVLSRAVELFDDENLT